MKLGGEKNKYKYGYSSEDRDVLVNDKVFQIIPPAEYHATSSIVGLNYDDDNPCLKPSRPAKSDEPDEKYNIHVRGNFAYLNCREDSIADFDGTNVEVDVTEPVKVLCLETYGARGDEDRIDAKESRLA